MGEFLPPRTSERDASPAEDPPPTMFKYRRLIPSIERLYTREYESNDGDNIVSDEPSYRYLGEATGKEKSGSHQALTARRRNLNNAAFTVQLNSRLRRDTHRHDHRKSHGNLRRHKAFNFPSDESEAGARRREKRDTSSPAVDAVDENPAQWRRFDNAKPQFVTSRTQQATGTRSYYSGVPQHRTSHTVDENDVHNMRYNEIPTKQIEQSRYSSDYVREPVDYRHEGEPPRRIIYYANLPEITRSRPADIDYRRERPRYDERYEYGRSYNKYPRESRYEDSPIGPPSGREAPYRYRQPGNGGNSYSIIDAERHPSQNAWPPTPYQQYRDPDGVSRYNRIPAPYQQPQTGERYAYDQRRGPPPPPPADGPNAALHPSRYHQYGRTGNTPRNQLTVIPSNPVVGDERYRDYNPRQPAPWSLQIGTKLTVKDDGRQMPSPGGKRFYVQSQQGYPSRYLRSEDDQDTRQI